MKKSMVELGLSSVVNKFAIFAYLIIYKGCSSTFSRLITYWLDQLYFRFELSTW